MLNMTLKDVGDGLHLYIENEDNYYLTIDFGGDKNINHHYGTFGYHFIDSFLLTHFHADHYNGIKT